jgi:hypothetical protein
MAPPIFLAADIPVHRSQLIVRSPASKESRLGLSRAGIARIRFGCDRSAGRRPCR